VLVRLLFFVLLCSTLNSATAQLPTTFDKLSTPLFHASQKFSNYKNILELQKSIREYQEEVKLLIDNGKRVDTSKDKKEIKIYLLKLRKLQKQYDYILHLIHKEILKSIKKEQYGRFLELTSIELEGLLENQRIKKLSFEFYEKNKGDKKSSFLEKMMHNEALYEATTQEFYNEIIQDSFSPDKQDKNSKKSVYIYTKNVKNGVEIYFANRNIYDVTIGVRPYYKNIIEQKNTSQEFALRGKSSLHYATLRFKKARSSYGYSYSWVMGNKDAVHDANYVYRLPYAKGTAQVISQGYNGKYTHKGSSQYAIDFAMAIGTKIYAARDGVVVKIKSDSNIGGHDKKFAKDGNYVTIAHSDGTLGTYYHLKRGGVVVSVGEHIYRGSHIAYSGNTGYSSGPHLHFAVFSAKNAKRTQTIPVKFKAKRGLVDPPLQGEYYIAK